MLAGYGKYAAVAAAAAALCCMTAMAEANEGSEDAAASPQPLPTSGWTEVDRISISRICRKNTKICRFFYNPNPV